jgi:hypothetical protein
VNLLADHLLGSYTQIILAEPQCSFLDIACITDVRTAGGKVVVRGTTSDNGTVKHVLVNGKEARALADNFAAWAIRLERMPSAEMKLTAYAEDAACNVEKRPHEWTVPQP